MKLFFAALYRYACSYTYIDVAISKKIGSLLKKTKIIFPKTAKNHQFGILWSLRELNICVWALSLGICLTVAKFIYPWQMQPYYPYPLHVPMLAYIFSLH